MIRQHTVQGIGDEYDGPQQHWVAALQGRVELLPTAELALAAMLISEGIYLSEKLGREVSGGGGEKSPRCQAPRPSDGPTGVTARKITNATISTSTAPRALVTTIALLFTVSSPCPPRGPMRVVDPRRSSMPMRRRSMVLNIRGSSLLSKVSFFSVRVIS